MSRKRILRLIAALVAMLLIVFCVMATYIIYSFYFGPLPQTDGVTTVAGLESTATVYRDSWAVPQVYADSDADLLFAMGYTHAQDRWWQMEISRYLGMARLHDILLTERETVQNIDRLMFTLGLEEAAQLEWENATPTTRQALEAYSSGVNAYIQERDVQTLASEYGLMGFSGQFDSLLIYLGRDVSVEPWEPYQSILLWKLFSLTLENNFFSGLEDAQILTNPEYSEDIRTILLDGSGIDPRATLDITYQDLEALETNQLPFFTREFFQSLGFAPVANAAVVVLDAARSENDAPLMAQSFFSMLEIPSMWYEIGLHCFNFTPTCTYNMAGFSIAGVPGIVVGHNDHLSWGVFPSPQRDTHELLLLPLDDEYPLQYQMGDDWLALQADELVLQTDENPNEAIEPYTRYRAENGVVVTELDADYALVLKWVPISQPRDTLSSLLALNRATDQQEFVQALQSWHYPAVDFVYADIEGNIGHISTGTRLEAPQPLPQLVVPSDRSAYREGAFIERFNPNIGSIILAANTDLQTRLEVRVNMQTQHTMDSLALVLSDNQDTLAPDFLPIIATLDFELENLELEAVQDWLVLWDGVNNQESSQAMFWAVFLDRLLLNLMDQWGLPQSFEMQEQLLWQLPDLLEQPEHPIWDSPNTTRIETRNDQVSYALDNTFLILSNEMGLNVEQWQLGDLLRADYYSRVIGYPDVLGNNLALDAGPFPINRDAYGISGGMTSINQIRYTTRLDEQVLTANGDINFQFAIFGANSFRLILDLSDFGKGRAMHNTGQSGHPASDHYIDMITPWRTMNYHNLYWGLSNVREASDQRLELEPQP